MWTQADCCDWCTVWLMFTFSLTKNQFPKQRPQHPHQLHVCPKSTVKEVISEVMSRHVSSPHPPGLSFSNHQVLAEHCRCLARLYLKRWRSTFSFKSSPLTECLYTTHTEVLAVDTSLVLVHDCPVGDINDFLKPKLDSVVRLNKNLHSNLPDKCLRHPFLWAFYCPTTDLDLHCVMHMLEIIKQLLY